MSLNCRELWSDDELVELIKTGDRKAFDRVYNRYSEKLYDAAYFILKDEALCEDIVHELFVSLWINRANLRIASLSSYLHTAIRNRVISCLRKRKIAIDVTSLQEVLSDFQSVENKLFTTDIQGIVDREVSKLPPKCQRIFELSRQEQRSNKEIAAELDIALKTVENQITIALRRLRASLNDFL